MAAGLWARALLAGVAVSAGAAPAPVALLTDLLLPGMLLDGRPSPWPGWRAARWAARRARSNRTAGVSEPCAASSPNAASIPASAATARTATWPCCAWPWSSSSPRWGCGWADAAGGRRGVRRPLRAEPHHRGRASRRARPRLDSDGEAMSRTRAPSPPGSRPRCCPDRAADRYRLYLHLEDLLGRAPRSKSRSAVAASEAGGGAPLAIARALAAHRPAAGAGAADLPGVSLAVETARSYVAGPEFATSSATWGRSRRRSGPCCATRATPSTNPWARWA